MSESSELNEWVVEKLVPGGDGICRVDGKVVFISGVLPGERVRAEILVSKKDYSRAGLIEVVEASPQRVTPVCPLSGKCGGCDWLHIGYQEQLRQKVGLVREALVRTAGFDFPGLEIVGGPPLRYRNRMQLHRDNQGRLGMMERGSNRVIPVSSCPIAVEPIESLLSGRSPGGNTGKDRFTVWGRGGGAQETPVLAGDQMNEADEVEVQVLNRKILFNAGCFFQSNLEMVEKLLPYALVGLEGGVAMDLYCGVGLFGAFLSERFKKIIAVEENPVSLEYARKNIVGINSAGDHEFVNLSLENWVEENPKFQADAVLVDPPRQGLGSSVRDFLIERKPERIVYVSCNPVTLARDLKSIVAGGYRLMSMKLFDFYPQTSHVESVARLEYLA